MCSFDGCKAKPEWRPVVILRFEGVEGRARCVLGVGLCTACKHKTTVASVLSDEGWEQLRAYMVTEHQLDPKREWTRLDFCGINSAEAKKYEASRVQIGKQPN